MGMKFSLQFDFILPADTFSYGSSRVDMRTKLEHIPTKSRKYGQYIYSTNTVRASLFPQNMISPILHHPDAKFQLILFSISSIDGNLSCNSSEM